MIDNKYKNMRESEERGDAGYVAQEMSGNGHLYGKGKKPCCEH
jgi:hypothetical protein